MDKQYLIIGSVLAMLAVLIGAFGAHGLEATLEANGRKGTYDTGVQYHIFHAIAILIVSLLMHRADHSLLNLANIFFVSGIVIFSGSLYALSLTNLRVLGMITPIGGLCFLIGWSLLIYYLIRAY